VRASYSRAREPIRENRVVQSQRAVVVAYSLQYARVSCANLMLTAAVLERTVTLMAARMSPAF
jgi:hypothetical protein